MPRLPEAVRELELRLLRRALARTRHQGKAADLLGLSYHQFRGLYRRHASDLAKRSHDD
jgi:psp operon transcriptional activator